MLQCVRLLQSNCTLHLDIVHADRTGSLVGICTNSLVTSTAALRIAPNAGAAVRAGTPSAGSVPSS